MTYKSSGETPTPSTTTNNISGWYAVGVLLIAYTLSFIDRTILALLVGPIKADLELSDTQVSLLIGLAFALFYTLMGLPIGRLADQYSRRWIMAVGIFFWSLMTAACGLARSFWTLFAARVGVGIGEATLSPSAYSMIADYFEASKLSRALAVYSTGVYIGAGLAFIIGGYVIELVTNAPPVDLPLIGQLAAWQLTFFAVGLPGALVAMLVLTVREPARRNSLLESTQAEKTTSSQSVEQASFGKTIDYTIKNWRTFGTHFLGFSFLALTFNAMIAWAPTMFIRKFGWTATEAGYVLGATILAFGAAGILSGGYLADFLTRHGKTDATIITGIVSALGVTPFAIGVGLASNAMLAAVMFAPFLFFSAFAYGAAAAALQIVSPNHVRAQISALYLFVLNLLGLGLGPTLVALCTDYVFQDESAVGASIALAGGTASILGGLFLLGCRKPFRESVARMSAG